ncbi:uroporphyrinogen-III C-methyltransferase [Emticicia sp. TH156]|uniref:uroporphyrinogen-III C-methyltransferase n=1 Tax=Emticicia sp. TH156 TaxID=2067454 RepID=UPI000C786BA9|nr:uroporphyrinogen-III C-methyltransferase [Emticicia sp. TH156]PLK43794.1 uroporphyrinogen-III C-methyltransferase [Emticicia sp. TH156]
MSSTQNITPGFLNPVPKLTVVGAGMGDPELITLKAINALRQADVVLYDALIDEELLEYCHPECERIYVGKRGFEKSVSQDSINFMIAEKAFEKGHVVRLKGGDPFIFGRGNEEIAYAKERGIETAYIPGVSSIMSGGFYEIPLTARGVADGFWVITGTKADQSLSADVRLAARSKSTVVILMGMKKLASIARIFEEEGFGNTPVAIIQNAATSEQKIGIGDVKNLPEIAEKNQLGSPAVILIGNVVKQNSIQHLCYIGHQYSGKTKLNKSSK